MRAHVDYDGPIPEHRPDLGNCYVWRGSHDRLGYGIVWTGERLRRVHTLTVPDIPEGLVRDHLCRNKACCRPSHIEAVTTRENIRRGLKGILNTHCPRGHEYTPENTGRPQPGSGKKCKECDREHHRRLARRRKAEAIIRKLASCRTDSATELQYLSLVTAAQQWVKAVRS